MNQIDEQLTSADFRRLLQDTTLNKMGALEPPKLRAYAETQITRLKQSLEATLDEENALEAAVPDDASRKEIRQKEGPFPLSFTLLIDNLLDEHHCGVVKLRKALE
jgi:hypothetical protein